MLTYKPVKLPRVPGYSYFRSPNGRESKAGRANLRRAILSAAEMARCKKRALWIGAEKQLVSQAMGKRAEALLELTGVQFLGEISKRKVAESNP